MRSSVGRRRVSPIRQFGMVLLAVLAGGCQSAPTPGVPLAVSATGEVPCTLGCVAWFLVRDADWNVTAPDVHPDASDGRFDLVFDEEQQRLVPTGPMIGGSDRIEPGLYKFVLAISEFDDTKPNTLLRTTYACTQRVNIPADVERVEARAHFGPDCGIEADIILR